MRIEKNERELANLTKEEIIKCFMDLQKGYYDLSKVIIMMTENFNEILEALLKENIVIEFNKNKEEFFVSKRNDELENEVRI